MRKFSWRTMLIFVISLLLGVMLIGLGTAYIAKLKQQRRQSSDTSLFTRHPDAETDLHLKASIPDALALRTTVIAGDGTGPTIMSEIG
jgi:hypothetical protein